MRNALLLSVLVMLATVPLAQASCHGCVDRVVEDCMALDGRECSGNAQNLVEHAPDRAVEIATDPKTFLCDDSDGPELDCA